MTNALPENHILLGPYPFTSVDYGGNNENLASFSNRWTDRLVAAAEGARKLDNCIK